MNAPTFNPIAEEAEELHRLLKWAPSIEKEGNAILQRLKRPLLAIHLRNGADWVRTTEKSPFQITAYVQDVASDITADFNPTLRQII